MGRNPRSARADRAWFLRDRPIEVAQEDRLGAMALAKTLVEAIDSAEPPCMIGLLGGFGSGKSSVTSLAASMLDDAEFDAVTVSADKHSGNARARNLVHAVAGEIQRHRQVDSDEVNEILRPLRQSSQVTAPDPTDTTWTRLRSGRYSFKKLLKSMAPSLVVAVVLAGVAFLAGGEVKSPALAGSGLVVFGWFLGLVFSWVVEAAKGLNAPASLSDHTPRAEAADEIEEVFGQLVDLHAKKRSGRRLVVFVDDIDRLSRDDLLDALRSLRSLQSVPRGSEPIFVISCDEMIMRSAVSKSLEHPATAHEQDLDSFANGSVGGDSPEHDTDVEDVGGTSSGHDHPALAFVDKLLTARVQMPPTMRGDMRRFALRAIGDDHPLRAVDGIEIERIVAILIHDGVSNPRSVIRLINRFIAAYLLAREREQRNEVALGDITDHTDVLAQLCVLLDEYPRFYAEIADNPALLPAARKVALRQENLTDSEQDALKNSAAFAPATTADDSSTPSFVRTPLRRFLSGTARRVGLPTDIGPLVHFMATPEGRVLGAQVRSEIISGVESGDHEDLAQVLGRIPDDQIVAAAGEIEQKLHDASAVDASTYISAVAPNLKLLENDISSAGDACADLLDQSRDEAIPAACLTDIISYTGPERHDLLCERLLRQDEPAEATNRRMVHAARYLASNAQIEHLVEPAIAEWIQSVPSEGSWELARHWLDVADDLNPARYGELHEQIVLSLVRSIRSEDGFTSEDAERVVSLAENPLKHDTSAAPNAEDLADEGPNTRSAFVHLWQITRHEGSVANALLAARAAADADIDLEVRMQAMYETAEWVDTWVDAEWDNEDQAESGEVSDVILSHLIDAARDPDARFGAASVIPDLVEALGSRAGQLMSAVTDAVERDPGAADAKTAAQALVQAAMRVQGTDFESSVDEHVARLLEAIDSDSDPSDPAVQLALGLIPAVAGSKAGELILEPQVQRWSSRLIDVDDTDHRNRLRGLRAAFGSNPSLIEHQADAQYLLDQSRQYIDSGSHPERRLRVLARFPWPDSQVEPALSIIVQHWENLPRDAHDEAFRLVNSASDEFDQMTRIHNLMAQAVESEPHGTVSEIAAAEIKRMRPTAARAVLASAVGKHEAVTDAWNSLDTDTAAEYIAQTTEATDITRLLSSLPEEHRAQTALTAMRLMASTAGITEAAVRAAASECDVSGLAEVAQTAITELQEQQGNPVNALRVIVAARESQADVDTDALQEMVIVLLPQCSLEVAGLLGRSLKGTRLTRELRTTLSQLRGGEANEKRIAGAFDAAYRT